ncbi:xylose isomerase-like protein [Lophiotrema nucula]|uniref:Xylose isomerase-like protein n=1 Tax=Lophiotrema nucula TaxID=690887 RepID=A0A6A5ZQD7_9PLEO|nr:xylose isomerase-like protein [Lophiotrema nucula]
MSLSPNIRWAVPSVSLGKHSSHTLERKISAAAGNGFNGIEIVFNELIQHARNHDQTPVASAAQINSLCQIHSITILSVNALKNFEEVALALALGTRIIQVPSMFLPDSTSGEDIIISELQALADLAAKHDLEIAYAAVAFAKHNPLWQDSLRITKAVNRPNFRICLDSYHILGKLWGDACAEDGRIAGGDETVAKSMVEFLKSCPKELVAYIQLSDASRWQPPLSMNDPAFNELEVEDARLLWSRVARPFPFEAPGYFPVADIAKIWLAEYGWDGWVS